MRLNQFNCLEKEPVYVAFSSKDNPDGNSSDQDNKYQANGLFSLKELMQHKSSIVHLKGRDQKYYNLANKTGLFLEQSPFMFTNKIQVHYFPVIESPNIFLANSRDIATINSFQTGCIQGSTANKKVYGVVVEGIEKMGSENGHMLFLNQKVETELLGFSSSSIVSSNGMKAALPIFRATITLPQYIYIDKDIFIRVHFMQYTISGSKLGCVDCRESDFFLTNILNDKSNIRASQKLDNFLSHVLESNVVNYEDNKQIFSRPSAIFKQIVL